VVLHHLQRQSGHYVARIVCTEFVLMRYRPLQKLSQWAALIGIPQDEEELIRHSARLGDEPTLCDGGRLL
jgi:hypothetical protein